MSTPSLDELKSDIEALEAENPHEYRKLVEFVCGLEYTDASRRSYNRLDDLEKERVARGDTRWLEFVLRTLNEADELNGSLIWQTGLWDNCSIEELIGGLIEAEQLLEMHKGAGE